MPKDDSCEGWPKTLITPEVIEKVHNIVLDINCNTFYIGRTNRNFNTRFKEHRKDFLHAQGKSKFSEHVPKEGHEMKTIE